MSDRIPPDSILKQYLNRKTDRAPSEGAPEETDAVEDHGCFGLLRGIRDRAVMLELRKKNGNILALGYSWLERAEFDPSEGITLTFGGRQIRINGRCLNMPRGCWGGLFNGIVRHRVSWINEADRVAGMEAGERAAVVDAISW